MQTLDDPAHDREAGSRDSTLDTTRIDDVRIGAARRPIAPPSASFTAAATGSSSSSDPVRSTITTKRSNTACG